MQDGQQGQVIRPGGQSSDEPQPPELQSSSATQTAPSQEALQPAPLSSDDVFVKWTASEYVANPKSAGWFFTLIIASVVLAVVAYLLTKYIFSSIIILLLGVIVGVFAARQPQVLEYKLDDQGLHIGPKFYPYVSFKSFSIAREHAMGYISLTPLKRFMPPMAIHYAPEDEDRIADILADYLPYEDHKPDVVDNITRRVRF